MAKETQANQLLPSTLSSERSSPALRVSQIRADEELLRKDKSYRRYASGVERALSLFDTTLQEWADYISFLGRLLRALQAHPANIPAVPHKVVIAKRLAQCLNPSLPSGVHQKSLEVYAYIFDMIGKNALSNDLPLYLPGLCPVLSFASLSVRPLFLTLLEAHVVKARPSILRPALKAIILALLPGLEDETSEDFQRIFDVLEKFKSAVNEDDPTSPNSVEGSGGEYFWQSFFLASIASSSRRQGVLAFLVRRLPRLGGEASNIRLIASHEQISADRVGIKLPQHIEAVLFPEPGLLIRCFATGLSDDQLLIQRGFLDLLVTHLPLHCHVIQDRISSADREQLVAAAVGVVTRREMSLNRRLWSWLLGPDPAKDDQTENSPRSPTLLNNDSLVGSSPASVQTLYFKHYGLQPLVSSVRNSIVQKSHRPSERARPLRICLSLMDRWEIGSLIIPEIFIPALDSVRRYEADADSKDQFLEVLRSASVFFDGVESGLICGEILELLVLAMSDHSSSSEERMDRLTLVKFILVHFNVREEEIIVVHLPMVLLALLTILGHENVLGTGPRQTPIELNRFMNIVFGIAELLLSAIPERAYLDQSTADDQSLADGQRDLSALQGQEVLSIIQRFYKKGQQHFDFSRPPFSEQQVGELLLRESSFLLDKSLEDSSVKFHLEGSINLFDMVLGKIPKTTAEKGSEIFPFFKRALGVSSESEEQTLLPFPILSALIATIISVVTHDTSARGPFLSRKQTTQLLPVVMRQLWAYLSPWNITHHVETVFCIWRLQSAMPDADRSICACICTFMVEGDMNETIAVKNADADRRFALLLTHSMPSHGKPFEPKYEVKKSVKQLVNQPSDLSTKTRYKVMLSRPLFLFLDALLDEGTERFFWARSWLQGLTSADKFFRFLIGELLAFKLFITSPVDEGSKAARALQSLEDVDTCIYYLQTISNVLRWINDDTWAVLAQVTVHNDDQIDERSLLACDVGFDSTLMIAFAGLCVRALSISPYDDSSEASISLSTLQRTASAVLQQLLSAPYSETLADLRLEHPLIDWLMSLLENPDASVQGPALDVLLAALSLRPASQPHILARPHRRTASRDVSDDLPHFLSTDRGAGEQTRLARPPPPELGRCLLAGFSSQSSRPVLDHWVSFLSACLPLFTETIFQLLIPLVECLCTQATSAFEDMKSAFAGDRRDVSINPEARIITLLTGLEYSLAYAHDSLMNDRTKVANVQSPEIPQGFLVNMVSGVFNSETLQTRSAAANNRLSVLLALRDTARTCFGIWSWGRNNHITNQHELSSLASFHYTTTRTRNRARRLLEHLFAIEPLECLENLVEVWCKALGAEKDEQAQSIIDLLHVLDGSKPKNTIPAVFNAIYSRTNPNALDPRRKSTLTSDLTDTDLVTFLSEYAHSVDDDAMDEIWVDCMTFLRDVLSNPFPHRQILPRLLEFTATLGEKVDNTSFGDQRMRRDLSDLFVRLLTATFTIKPTGFSQEPSHPALTNKGLDTSQPLNSNKRVRVSTNDDVLSILVSVVPKLPRILIESERLVGAAYIISTNVIGPAFRSKMFPHNLSINTLKILFEITRLPNAQKLWKKDVAEAFNHPRFFEITIETLKTHWLPLVQQWVLGDKDRMPELLSRLTSPSTAGIMFGVGASSARLEADRKTQLNLRRIALLVLASAQDSFVVNIAALEEKLEELLMARPASSPSSATRAEIYMVLRAVTLRISSVHLSSLWSVINAELQAALSSVLPDEESGVFNDLSVLQACKLLDTLVVMAPEEFQVQEWLFITDSIDAVYRPSGGNPVALVDELSEKLGATSSSSSIPEVDKNSKHEGTLRKPLLGPDCRLNPNRDDLLGTVLKPFFSQLSIYAFESIYSMGAPDLEACVDGLLTDLFDESTIVGAQ